MGRYNKKPNFKVKINYPTKENIKEYEHRKAKAVAKVLVDILPPMSVEELIKRL